MHYLAGEVAPRYVRSAVYANRNVLSISKLLCQDQSCFLEFVPYKWRPNVRVLGWRFEYDCFAMLIFRQRNGQAMMLAKLQVFLLFCFQMSCLNTSIHIGYTDCLVFSWFSFSVVFFAGNLPHYLRASAISFLLYAEELLWTDKCSWLLDSKSRSEYILRHKYGTPLLYWSISKNCAAYDTSWRCSVMGTLPNVIDIRSAHNFESLIHNA